jgi:YesN/AraC family two-component response regulator
VVFCQHPQIPHQFGVVITDQTMPDMTALSLARQLLAFRKDLHIILSAE